MPTPDRNDQFTPLTDRLRSSILLRLLGLGGSMLLLQIPIGMIDGTIAERRASRMEAVESVTKTWGGRQVVRGPFLVVPYVRRWVDEPNTREAKPTVREETEYLYVLPTALTIDGNVDAEVRRRGIFDVPLYVARLTLGGSFRLPQPNELPSNTVAIRWDQTTLVLGLSDPRAIRDTAALEWNGARVPVEPGTGRMALFDRGLNAAVPIGVTPAGESLPFGLRLTIAGSDGVSFLPAGSESTVHVQSRWRDPSFDGAYLPAERTVGPQGFEATWRVSHLARNFPGAWQAGEVRLRQLDEALLGVSLLSPVDAYRTTDRAVKYEMLFIGLTFLSFLLFELIAGLRVHPVQYLLVGLALCLFYLLLLSFAEHVGFVAAYAIASIAIATLTTAYSRAVLGGWTRGIAIAGEVGFLYAYLFVLLQIQDYALLVGAVGLFFILAVVMFLTRRIDWYTLHTTGPPARPGEAMG